MEVHADDPLEASHLEHIRDQSGTDAFTAACAPVQAGIAEVWNDYGEAVHHSPPTGVGQEQQFPDIMRDWRTSRLDQIHVLSAHTFPELDMKLAAFGCCWRNMPRRDP
jgi:hypothetical protein